MTNSFDALGRRTLVTDGLGNTTNKFDNVSRLTKVSNAFGQVQKTIKTVAGLNPNVAGAMILAQGPA